MREEILLNLVGHDDGLEIKQQGDEVIIDMKHRPLQRGEWEGWRFQFYDMMESIYRRLHEGGAISREHSRIDWERHNEEEYGDRASVMRMTIRSSDPIYKELARELLKSRARDQVDQQTRQLLRQYPDQFTVKKIEGANGQDSYQLDFRPPPGMENIKQFTQAVSGLRGLTNYLAELFAATSPPTPTEGESAQASESPPQEEPAESPKLLTYQPLILNLPPNSFLGRQLDEMASERAIN